MYELMKENQNNVFYPVKIEAIRSAENNMGRKIPESLIDLYLNVGYGFLESFQFNINRIMGPSSVEDFFFSTGQFENSDEAEAYAQYLKDKIVFFEVNDSLYLAIGNTAENKGKIYYYDEIIANNLKEFLDKYLCNERFFLE